MSGFNSDYELYELGTIQLQRGGTIPNAVLAYKTYGQLNDTKSNVIIYPTWFTGFIENNEWLIGEGMALDPSKYFIIVVCAFGNSQSSSPSNTKDLFAGPNFPQVTLYDNVFYQHKFITEKFDIKKIKLLVGWSMGAQQTYQWASLYPEMVERIAPMCGSAKTAIHNWVFLQSVKTALKLDFNYLSGYYTEPPVNGLKAVANVYAGWGFSQQFYNQELYKNLGFNTVEDFISGFWEKFFLQRDANNLLCMLDTWQNADISDNPIYKNDLIKALNSIKAKTYVIPAEKDLYFTPDVSAWEVSNIPNAELFIVPGDWGHFAVDGLNPVDTFYVDNLLKQLLDIQV